MKITNVRMKIYLENLNDTKENCYYFFFSKIYKLSDEYY